MCFEVTLLQPSSRCERGSKQVSYVEGCLDINIIAIESIA